MNLLNLNSDDDEIQREYLALARRASFRPGDDVLPIVIFVLQWPIIAVWCYLLTYNLIAAVVLSFVLNFVGPGFFFFILVFLLIDWFGVHDVINRAYVRNIKQKSWYQRYELLKDEVERINTEKQKEKAAIKEAQKSTNRDLRAQPIRPLSISVPPGVSKEPNSVLASQAKQTKARPRKSQTSRLIEVSSPKPINKVPTREEIRLPKRSASDWERIARNRHNLGACGELLAFEFEYDRVLNTEGPDAARSVLHASTENDALGYDIVSVLNGVDVYIEVKTTSGGFWTDFFITTNELNSMRKFGERYWVYRIHGLDRKTGQGLVSVFRGVDEIDNYFSFEPRTFAFRPRESGS